MQKKIRLSFYIGFLFAFLSDFTAKIIIFKNLISGDLISYKALFFSIMPVFHTGGFMGIGNANFLFFSLLSLVSIILVLFLYLFYPAMNKIYSISAGLIFGGLISNFLNRLLQGGITNYIHIPSLDKANASLLIFNLADFFIISGVIFSFIYTLIKNRQRSKLDNSLKIEKQNSNTISHESQITMSGTAIEKNNSSSFTNNIENKNVQVNSKIKAAIVTKEIIVDAVMPSFYTGKIKK